jgi:hypothetical protein
MFKALLLIYLGQADSERDLAEKLQFDVRLQSLCGFDFFNTPSHVSFHDFRERLGSELFYSILHQLIAQAITNGGYDGKVWRIGHVRTHNFRTFEPNPRNPVFTPSSNRDAWDCDGVLTPQIIEIGDTYYMLYAGKKDKEWQTGLTKVQKP